MSYELTFNQGSNYLHAIVSGTNSRKTVAAYMDDVLAECRRSDCFRVLIEERLEGPRLTAMDVFAVSSEGSMKALGVFEAVAYVDEQMGELRDFVETVAVNRGMPVATFATVGEADAWLTRQQTPADEKRIFHDPDATA